MKATEQYFPVVLFIMLNPKCARSKIKAIAAVCFLPFFRIKKKVYFLFQFLAH